MTAKPRVASARSVVMAVTVSKSTQQSQVGSDIFSNILLANRLNSKY